MAILTPVRHRFYNNDGTVANGGKVYIYEAGTTTPKDSYTSSAEASLNTFPVILDSKGECDLWVAGTYKINVTEDDDTQVTGYPVDNCGASQSSYDIAQYFSGKPTNGQEVLRFPCVRPITFDVNMTLSRASARVAATASTIFIIAKNGTQIGTMTFAIAGTTATFTMATPPAFAAGDVLTVTGPATADATLEDIGFVIVGAINP